MTAAYFQRVCPTYLENWDFELTKLSIPHIDIPLTRAMASALGSRIRGFKHWFDTVEDDQLDAIQLSLDIALRNFPGGAVVRLGSRSPKDSVYAQKYGLRVESGEQAISLLTDYSERVAYDLRLAMTQRYDTHIFVRKWVDIPPWAEFRCFMKNCELVGITQYNCDEGIFYPEIDQQALSILSAISSFFPKFERACHMNDVVFDVFLVPSGAQAEYSVTLIELNPFVPKTDTGFFEPKNGLFNFDSTFRYRSASVIVNRLLDTSLN